MFEAFSCEPGCLKPFYERTYFEHPYSNYYPVNRKDLTSGIVNAMDCKVMSCSHLNLCSISSTVKKKYLSAGLVVVLSSAHFWFTVGIERKAARRLHRKLSKKYNNKSSR